MSYIDLICAYLPSHPKDCVSMISEIDDFIVNNNITTFSFFGDFNIHLNSNNMKSKSLLDFVEKHNLENLAEKLNALPNYTWRGLKKRSKSTSVVDYFFTNEKLFSQIQFLHNSFSDHKHCYYKIKEKIRLFAPLVERIFVQKPRVSKFVKIRN